MSNNSTNLEKVLIELTDSLALINDLNSNIKYRVFALFYLDFLNNSQEDFSSDASYQKLLDYHAENQKIWLKSVAVLGEFSKKPICIFTEELNKDLSLILDEIINKEITSLSELEAVDREFLLFINKYYDDFFRKKICYSCIHCLDFIFYVGVIFKVLGGEINLEEAEQQQHYYKVTQVHDEIIDIIRNKKEENIFNIEKDFVGESKKPIVYFDQNVLVKYETSEDFKNKINRSKKSFSYAYSPSHLEEIYKRSDSEKKQYVLNELIELTEKLVILPWDEGMKLFYEDPFHGMERVAQDMGQAAKLVEKLRLLKYEGRKILHKEYLEFGKSINNKSLFGEDKDLLEKVLRSLSSGFSLNEIQNIENISVNYNRVNNIIYKLYNAMDILGYWKEKNSDFRAIKSSVHDIEHLIYATCTDIFVTSDEKCYKRSSAIFNHIKPSMKVYLVDDFINTIEKFDN